MSNIPANDPFWEIIDYLNEKNMQGDSRIWKTSVGNQWIYWGKFGWERKLVDIENWPITKKEIDTICREQ